MTQSRTDGGGDRAVQRCRWRFDDAQAAGPRVHKRVLAAADAIGIGSTTLAPKAPPLPKQRRRMEGAL